VGDLLGIRGPYGNSFKPIDGRVLVVGGGSGLAPLTFLAEKLAHRVTKIFFILGAKTSNELLFLRRIENTLSNTSSQITAMTEDGSYGERGVATTAAKTILEKEKIDMIYTCGPELMMLKMLTLAEQYNTPLQASLERLMRCALGLCGSCVIGRFTVCKDGPVFSDRQLSEVKHEFGHFRRGASGKLVPLQS
jgi:dihydroorotate dehydrogenase electron transfer subunit